MDIRGNRRVGRRSQVRATAGKSRPHCGTCSSGREGRETIISDPNVMKEFCEVTMMTVIVDGASLVFLLTSFKKRGLHDPHCSWCKFIWSVRLAFSRHKSTSALQVVRSLICHQQGTWDPCTPLPRSLDQTGGHRKWGEPREYERGWG